MLKPNGEIFSICRRTLGDRTWGRVLAAMETIPNATTIPEALERLTPPLGLPGYIADLARLEQLLYENKDSAAPLVEANDTTAVNPTVSLLQLSWKHLPSLIRPDGQRLEPVQESIHAMLWRPPRSQHIMIRDAESIDLLALKLVVEGVEPMEAAEIGQVTVGEILNTIHRGVDQGFLLGPASRIRRTGFQIVPEALTAFATSDVFTLQWHLTQACDLNCKHCYDRSDRRPLPLETAMTIIDDFHGFCRRMNVRGQISFTGGNPLLYRHFDEVYRAALSYGFSLAILGNPTSREQLDAILSVAPPVFYQISLEGLAAHNDEIRGRGHFDRSMAFLDELRSRQIYAMVMLTLTRNNLAQVLPLAEQLRNRADFFTFNRLSTVGRGAHLQMVEPSAFRSFLAEYHAAAVNNPIMGLKDNLFNVIRSEMGLPPFGGCTGHGCGAAFNFLALLPDGEVHACRKFPSRIGRLGPSTLYDIYRSDLAERYRNGALACRKCSLNTVCRGCLAIAYSLGRDIFTDKDPFCFAAEESAGKISP